LRSEACSSSRRGVLIEPPVASGVATRRKVSDHHATESGHIVDGIDSSPRRCDGGHAQQKNGTSDPKADAIAIRSRRDWRPPNPAESDERRCRVGTPAAETGRGRNPLHQANPRIARFPVRPGQPQRIRRTPDQVRPVGGHAARPVDSLNGPGRPVITRVSQRSPDCSSVCTSWNPFGAAGPRSEVDLGAGVEGDCRRHLPPKPFARNSRA
jgi:hypothetical protein